MPSAIKLLRAALGAILAAGACACATAPAGPSAASAAGAASPDDASASPYGLFLAGETARYQGRLDAAAGFLTRAAAAQGDPPALANDAFAATLEAGDVGAAARIAPQAPDQPSWRLGVIVRGVEDLAERKDRAALGLFTTSGLAFPERVAADLLAPFAAAGAGDTERALVRPVFDADPSDQFVADLDRAELLELIGRPAEAEAAFKALILAGDQNGAASQAYAALLERRAHGRTSGVRPATRAPSLLGEAAEALLVPAASLAQQRDDPLALIYLRLALRLDPANDAGWEMVGDLLAQADPDAARAAYAHVGAGGPRFAAARDKLAWLEQRSGDREDALKTAQAAAAGAPGDRDAQSSLALILSDDGRYAEAANLLTGLLATAGARADWRLYYLRASAENSLGEWARTEADLSAALALAPDEPELLNFEGYYWIERGQRLKESLAMVQKAAAAEPQSGEIVDSLGWAYYRLGDYPQAVETLERAVGLDPGSPEINDHLADAYWRVGRRLEAQFQWRLALTLDPSAALRAMAQAKLASPLGPDAPAAAAAGASGLAR